MLKKMEMFKCEYPRLESLLKDTRFPSTHESPVEERVIQQFAQSLESETNRFFRDYSPAAKIKAVEDLYGEAVEFAHQRDRRRYKPVSKYLQQHSTAFPTLYLVYQYLFCQPASSAAVERSFSVQGCFMLGRRNGKCYKKNTFDKLAREIAAELGKIPRVIQPILFVVQGQPFWRRLAYQTRSCSRWETGRVRKWQPNTSTKPGRIRRPF